MNKYNRLILSIFVYWLLIWVFFSYLQINTSIISWLISLFALGAFTTLLIYRNPKVWILIILFSVLQFTYQDYYRLWWSHDPWNYASEAVNISKYGSVESPNIYKITWPWYILSLNQKTVIHFPPLYSYFLSWFYSIFGIPWFVIANLLLLFSSVYFLQLIWTQVFWYNKKSILLLVLLVVTSYFVTYITRETYIESFLMFFLWSWIYYFITWFEERNVQKFLFGWISYWPICLIRNEFFVYWLWSVVIFSILIFIILKKDKQISYKNNWRNTLAMFWCIFSIFLYVFYTINIDPETAKEVFWQISSSAKGTWSIIAKWLISYYNEHIFSLTFVLWNFTISLTLFFLLFWFKGKKILIMAILILMLPQILFIIKPWIAFYLPRSFRRFYPGIYFVAFMIFIYHYQHYKNRIILLLLVFFQVILSSHLYYKPVWSEIIKLMKYISKLHEPVIFYDVGATEEIWSITSDYFNKPNIILDRPPFKDKKYYDYLIGNQSFYIVTTLRKEIVIKNFMKDFEVDITSNISFVEGKTYYSNKVQSFCDLRKEILNPSLFKSYWKSLTTCFSTIWSYDINQKIANIFYIQNTGHIFSWIQYILTNEDRGFRKDDRSIRY